MLALILGAAINSLGPKVSTLIDRSELCGVYPGLHHFSSSSLSLYTKQVFQNISLIGQTVLSALDTTMHLRYLN